MRQATNYAASSQHLQLKLVTFNFIKHPRCQCKHEKSICLYTLMHLNSTFLSVPVWRVQLLPGKLLLVKHTVSTLQGWKEEEQLV